MQTDGQIFQRYGVPQQQLHLNGGAADTLTNFTTTVNDFSSYKLENIYLVTSDYHMRRSMAIVTIILGSQGIAVTPLRVPSTGEYRSESFLRVLRDCGRSFLWIVTRRTGASLNAKL